MITAWRVWSNPGQGMTVRGGGLANADPYVGAGPGMVAVGPIGEHLTEAAFAARYPRSLLIELPSLRRDAPTGDGSFIDSTDPATVV